MKKIFIFASIILFNFIFLNACRPDCGAVSDFSSADSESAFAAFGYDFNETMNITWCVTTHWTGFIDPSECRIAALLNERYNVVLDAISTNEFGMIYQEKLLKDGGLPDIYRVITPLVNNYIENGGAREIPVSFLEAFAPRYYSAIINDEKLNEKFRNDPVCRYALMALSYEEPMLYDFSVYRLDWLERSKIAPKGDPVELYPGIWFTDKAFDINEFIGIMASFTDAELGRYGCAIPGRYLFPSVNPLFGLFGLTFGRAMNVNENGSAVYFLASDGFRSFASFLRRLKEGGVMHAGDSYVNQPANGLVGWWTESVFLPNNRLFENLIAVREANRSAKFLITPPEIGPDESQTADGNLYGSGFVPGSACFLVNADVSDSKLARILSIFDAVSFDPDLYVLTTYGFEGEDFYWAGEPYESGVEVINYKYIQNSPGTFATGVMDGTAGKAVYNYPSRKLYDFAKSPEALAMIGSPYKEVASEDEFAMLLEKINIEYGKQLYGLMYDYLEARINGRNDETDGWEAYLSVLRANGLDEINAYFNAR